jgi:hypothetical protein
MTETCKLCDGMLVEFDHDGLRITGCVACNQWEADGESFQLNEDDWIAIRDDPIPENAFHFLIANEADQIQSYVERGRLFRDLGDTALDEKFVEIARSWASAPYGPAERRLMSDIQSEFALRKRVPPIELAKDDLRTAIKAATDAIAALPDERKQEIGAEFLSEYKDATKRQN